MRRDPLPISVPVVCAVPSEPDVGSATAISTTPTAGCNAWKRYGRTLVRAADLALRPSVQAKQPQQIAARHQLPAVLGVARTDHLLVLEGVIHVRRIRAPDHLLRAEFSHRFADLEDRDPGSLQVQIGQIGRQPNCLAV